MFGTEVKTAIDLEHAACALALRDTHVAQVSLPLSSSLAFQACNAYTGCMQYTIRGIPDVLDEAIRRRARAEGKSLNEVAIEALAEGLGVEDGTVARRDLTDIVGTWKKDSVFDAVLAEQDQIEESLWK